MKTLQKYLLYIFFFSINFELWDPFNLHIDFIITKVTSVLYLLSTLSNFKSFYSLVNIKKYIYPIFGFFILLTVMSYIYRTVQYPTYFNVAILLNLILLIALTNHAKLDPQILLKGLFVFSLSTIVLTIMYLLEFNTEYLLKNRITIFRNNQNELGLKLGISILILISIINENKLKFGRLRFLIYICLPFIFLFMVKTGSRVAFISFFLGFLFFFIHDKKRFSAFKLIKIILVSIFLIASSIFLLENSFLADRLNASINNGDLSGRDTRWLSSLALVAKNPILGLGQTGYSSGIKSILGYYTNPHNVLIETLVYTGIIGFSLMALFLTGIAKCVINEYKIYKNILPSLLIIPIIGLILSGQILSQKIVWLIFAYIIAQNKYSHSPKFKN